MTTLPDLDRMHAKVSAAPVSARRSGFAVNIGGVQGGGEPLDAPRIEDLWEIADAYPDLRARVKTLEDALERIAKSRYGLEPGSSFEEVEHYWSKTAMDYRYIAKVALDPSARRATDENGGVGA